MTSRWLGKCRRSEINGRRSPRAGHSRRPTARISTNEISASQTQTSVIGFKAANDNDNKMTRQTPGSKHRPCRMQKLNLFAARRPPNFDADAFKRLPMSSYICAVKTPRFRPNRSSSPNMSIKIGVFAIPRECEVPKFYSARVSRNIWTLNGINFLNFRKHARCCHRHRFICPELFSGIGGMPRKISASS